MSFDAKVSVIIPTYKRLKMFRQCYKSLAKNPGIDDYRLFIWDNGSGEDMKKYLKEIVMQNYRARVHFCPNDIGCSVYAEMAKWSRSEHIIFMDDDIIEFPDGWMKEMVEALWDAPFPWRVWGMLSTNVVRDSRTNGALWPDKRQLDSEIESASGRKFITGGSYGGWCAITHRTVYEQTKGFPRKAFDKKTGESKKFFAVDGFYGEQVKAFGLKTGIIKDLTVHHASGPWWNKNYGYEDLWQEKTGETIAQSAEAYLKRDASLTAMEDLI